MAVFLFDRENAARERIQIRVHPRKSVAVFTVFS
jgi:hypothetical protein